MLLFLMRLKLWQTVGWHFTQIQIVNQNLLPTIHPSIHPSFPPTKSIQIRLWVCYEICEQWDFVNGISTKWRRTRWRRKKNKHYRYLCLINSVLNSNLNCFSRMKLFATHLNVFDEAFNRYWCAAHTHLHTHKL